MSITDEELWSDGGSRCGGGGSPDWAELCVLASGSAGNCSVLAFGRGPRSSPTYRRVCLIDLGVSPRRTVRMLAALGLGLHHIDDVVLTHLDTDHFHSGWVRSLPAHATMRVHVSHAARTDAFGLFGISARPFDSGFTLDNGTDVRSVLMEHDDEGVAAFRFDVPGCGSLGFATDLGRATHRLIGLMESVDVLAIESNYCPKLQESSGRPEYLKRRITGGKGHLSNHEAIGAINLVRPAEHVVLLHLSRECNDPAIVAELHAGADYSLTITDQHQPSRWIRIGALRAAHAPRS